jgi:uncharacterized protein
MKTHRAKKWMLGLTMIVVAWPTVAAEWTIQTVPNVHVSDARQYVSDPENLIDPSSKAEMNRLLTQADKQLTAEVAVVALSSVGSIESKDFATELFNYWKVGKKEKDNGLLILLVMDQRKISFETGYGLEGVLPDVVCFRIIQDIMIPYVKQGQIGQGMVAGVQMVLQKLSDPSAAREITVDQEALVAAERERQWKLISGLLIAYVLISIVVLFLAAYRLGRNGKRLAGKDPYEIYKTLNTEGVGYRVLSFLFPLTMLPFWWYYRARRNAYRKQPRNCPDCGKPLVLMTESQEDAYLDAGQQAEETVGSIDYDAWVCMDCGHRTFLSYAKSFTRYQSCPQCRYKTYAQINDRIVTPPTPLSAGQGVHVFHCANCGHESVAAFVIPMIVVLPSGRGNGGFGGGFGGGGFSGGSFGGGSSGGGGATGGW